MERAAQKAKVLPFPVPDTRSRSERVQEELYNLGMLHHNMKDFLELCEECIVELKNLLKEGL